MLKAIAFKNFVHFKNKTVIIFDDSIRRQSGNSNVDGRPNFLNIFVGANFSGKSTVLELIRRCMEENINTSVTSSADEKQVAYAFCKFQKGPDPVIISGIIKDPNTKIIYKVIFSSDKLDIIVYSPPSLRDVYKCRNSLDAGIPIIFSNKDDDGKIYGILQKIKDACQDETKVTVTVPETVTESTWGLWDSIKDKYVATFPLRGIGSIQWSKSKKIGGQRDTNYTEAYNRAEILSASLSEEDEDKNFFAQVDVVEEKRIFKYLTDLDDFKVDKNTGNVTVTRNEKRTSFPLLKISEGIFEAKSTSLLLANEKLETLCLEEPERGMHPQMIERLKSVLYGISFEKTIIIVTHSPYFIDSMTIDKTHVFFRTKNEPFACSVKIGQSDELSKVADIEINRTLLFATRVLLVEGVTDKEVVQGILTENKCQKLKENKSSLEEFTDISIHQIIPVGGCSNAAKVQKFCNDINLPCLCLLDLDAAVKFNFEQIKKFESFDMKWQEMFKQTRESYEKESKQFFEKLQSQLKVFIWKHGALEHAILSSANCIEGIAEALGVSVRELNPIRLKTKLKERIDDERRKRFYTELMKVDEIKRFIEFMEDNTCTIEPTGAGVNTQ